MNDRTQGNERTVFGGTWDGTGSAVTPTKCVMSIVATLATWASLGHAEVRVEDHAVTFTTQGVTIRNLRPAATLYSADEKEKIEWAPKGPADGEDRKTEVTNLGSCSWRIFTWKDARGFSIEWHVGTLAGNDGMLLKMRLHNNSGTNLFWETAGLGKTDGPTMTVGGAPSEWVMMGMLGFKRIYGNLEEVLPSNNEVTRRVYASWKIACPTLSTDERAEDGHWRSFEEFATLYRGQGAEGIAMAPIGVESSLTYAFRVDKGRCIFEATSPMGRVLIPRGTSKDGETLAILSGPYEKVMPRLARATAKALGVTTVRDSLVGYCSWYHYTQGVREQNIIDVAHAARDVFPWQVIQIDDGFQRQYGDWRTNNKFGGGWDPIVKAIKEAGAMPGLWIAGIWMDQSVKGVDIDPSLPAEPLLKCRPDWFLRSHEGKLSDPLTNGGGKAYVLDPTHPDVQKYLRSMIRKQREAGFRYFKIDFSSGVGGRFHDRTKTTFQASRDMWKLWREEIGPDGFLLACGLSRNSIGSSEATRIGPDSCAPWKAVHPCCIWDCIRAVGMTSFGNGIFSVADPDVTYLKPRGGLTIDELRTWHGLVGLMGGMTMISEPIHEGGFKAPEVRRMMEILTPPAKEKGLPLNPGTDPDAQHYGFVYERPWGRAAAIQVYNADDRPADRTLDARLIQPLGEKFHAWSFWDGAYLGVVDRGYTFKALPPHAPRLLRLTALSKDPDSPLLVGSDLHISTGAAEIKSFAFKKGELTIDLTDAGARSGTLYVLSSKGLKFGSAAGLEATVTDKGNGLWAIAVTNRQRGKEQRIVCGGE